MKINGTDIIIKIVKNNIGLFHLAVRFTDHEKNVIEEMIEWLSNNCQENFIVTEIRSSIVAGGFSDNKKAFKQGHFKLGKKNARQGELYTKYEIRLDKIDVLAFRLRWIDESKI